MLISCAVTAQLICSFVFANADGWFSDVAAQIGYNEDVIRLCLSCGIDFQKILDGSRFQLLIPVFESWLSQGYLKSHQENMSMKCVPPDPHFYIVKLGYAGVYLIFLFLLQNIDCGYSLEPPRRGGSNVYPQSMF